MPISILLGLALFLAAPATADGTRLAPIVEPYLRIQRALSADTLDAVPGAASGIMTGAAKLGDGGEAIGLAAAELRQASGLPEARAAFDRLTRAVVASAAGSIEAFGDGVQLAYCPMARKYWLQSGPAIRNPYYGASMLECGRLVPAIPDHMK